MNVQHPETTISRTVEAICLKKKQEMNFDLDR